MDAAEGESMKMRWPRALVLALLITPWCWTPLRAQGSCNKTPTLSGPSSVTRFSDAIFTIGNLCKTATVRDWIFMDGSTPWPRGSSGATSWQGKMVQSGTVQVTVVQGGITYPLSKSVTVNPRTTGFAFTAKPATKFANGTFHCINPQEDILLVVPDPPTQPGQDIGMMVACLRYSFNFTQVSDTGPNGGFWYVTSVSDSVSGEVPPATTFAWTMSQQLDDPTSDFYKAQCGSGGFISGAQLQANTVAHESGSLNSHYSRYVAAQNNPANNVGTGLEAVVGPPSDGVAGFRSRAQLEGSARQNRIITAAKEEPCGASDVAKDENCVPHGSVNYPPYQSCGGCQSDLDCSSQPAPYNQCVSGRCGNASCPAAPPASSVCIPSGGVDDILGNTDCCSGTSVSGSGCCIYQEDWGGSWASCSQICG
jgi:hypothetical protein